MTTPACSAWLITRSFSRSNVPERKPEETSSSKRRPGLAAKASTAPPTASRAPSETILAWLHVNSACPFTIWRRGSSGDGGDPGGFHLPLLVYTESPSLPPVLHILASSTAALRARVSYSDAIRYA